MFVQHRGQGDRAGCEAGGTGQLVANDISVSRAMALAKNLQIAGAVNAVVTAEKPERLQESFSQYFDGILIDAPCSGEGCFAEIPIWYRIGKKKYRNIMLRSNGIF